MTNRETRPERRLAAIMATDVVGYSRLMQSDEGATLAALASIQELTQHQIGQHGGRIANTAGDSVLAEFASAVDAVSCAMVLQEVLAQKSPDHRDMQLRIGIHIGDVVTRGEDVFGTAVNIAARLEGLSQPGGIVVSAAVRDDIAGKLPASFVDLGLKSLKNIEEPLRAFSLSPQIGGSALAIQDADRRLKMPHKAGIAIAVLPFANMSSDPEQEFLADGLTEDLITELSRLKDFLVIARNTVFTYKGRAVDVSQVARDLSVRYVLEGSIRRLGPRVRIKAQLIEALSGNHLWAEKFDRDLAEIFEVQDEVVRAVAACTQTRLIITEGEAAERGRNIDAWALITRGWTEIYRLTRESLESAAEIGRRLVAHYPSLSKGHHILASALHHLVIMGFYRGTQDIQDVIVSEAREAVRLDPTDEYALWVLAMVLSDALGRPQEAIPLLRQALSLNPNFSLGYGLLGNAYSQLNQPDEAIKYTEIAIRLNPRDPSVFFRYAVLAEANFAKQDHQQTLHWANQSAALKPDYWYSHALIASTLAISGDMDGAKRAMANLQASMQGVSVSAIQQTGYYPEPWWSRFAQGLIAAGALP